MYVHSQMGDLRFTWDLRKSADNVRKHGVSFEEAQSAFADEHALLIDDPDHSSGEERFVLLGRSSLFRLLVVVHCYREPDNIIRLISARRATRPETEIYTDRWEA